MTVRHFVVQNLRKSYSPSWGWVDPPTKLEIGVDAFLTGRFKIINSETLQLEVRYKQLVKRDVPSSGWRSFLISAGFIVGYEIVSEEVTCWVDAKLFSWETVVECEEKHANASTDHYK